MKRLIEKLMSTRATALFVLIWLLHHTVWGVGFLFGWWPDKPMAFSNVGDTRHALTNKLTGMTLEAVEGEKAMWDPYTFGGMPIWGTLSFNHPYDPVIWIPVTVVGAVMLYLGLRLDGWSRWWGVLPTVILTVFLYGFGHPTFLMGVAFIVFILNIREV